ncbi:MAG: glycoside hydrolase family 16 protein [Solirubrobacteraceae bacterium]
MLVVAVLVGIGVYELARQPVHGPSPSTSTSSAAGSASQPVVTPPPQRVPMPTGNLPGWREVFADDFNGSRLDTSRWRVYQGQPAGDPAGWWEPSHVAVSDGMLVISAYRDAADGGRWTSGGVSTDPGFVQTYGKYEVRFRFEQGVGIGHALLLIPQGGVWPPEIDFSEDNGSGRDTTLVTLHYPPGDQRISHHVHVNLTQWHTLGVQWTPRLLRYTLDGRVWSTTAGSEVPSLPMALAIQTQAWPCTGTWGVCPDTRTPRVVRLYVDWVVAYAPAAR